MSVIFSALGYVSIVLQFVLLGFLFLGGSVRRYPLLVIYSLVFLAATLAERFVLRAAGLASANYRVLYMTDEVIIDLVLFLMVVVMTYQAMGENPLRAKIGRLLAMVVIGTVLLPFILYPGPVFSSRWFNETSQMLNFGAAIMNLALWTALLGNRRRDPLMLSVSAGLGVAVTGAAITYGLHHFAWTNNPTVGERVDLIKSLAHVGSLLIWCRAFWPAAKRAQMSPRAVTSP
jgi:hypothetical protein